MSFWQLVNRSNSIRNVAKAVCLRIPAALAIFRPLMRFEKLSKTVTNMYENGEFDELYVCYDHFVNRISSTFRGEKMLPVDQESLGTADSEESDVHQLATSYDVEPSVEEVLKVVLPQYSESLIFGAILDAKTAEHASSSTAMKSASDNATDLIVNWNYDITEQDKLLLRLKSPKLLVVKKH